MIIDAEHGEVIKLSIKAIGDVRVVSINVPNGSELKVDGVEVI